MEKLGVEKVFTDRMSGKNTDRPELKKMMDFVREGDTLVVESISRFARSAKDLWNLTEELERKGVQFISQKESFNRDRINLSVFSIFQRDSHIHIWYCAYGYPVGNFGN